MIPRKSRSGLSTMFFALLIAGGMLPLAGCSWFSDDEPEAPPPQQQTASSPEDADYDLDEAKPDVPPAKEKLRNNIIALVNDQPISVYDLDQRVGLIMVTSNIPDTAEMRKKVREQALEQLETEQIQRQESQKNDITVSTPEVDKRVKDIIGDSNISEEQLKDILKQGHVSMATFRSQIANQILWQKAVQAMYAGRVNIAPETVNAEMARIRASAGKVHYAVAEIFVAVDNPEQDEKARKDIQGLHEQIKAGAPFQAIARQFSQSPSAAQGGNIGVIYDGQLAPELNTALGKMKTGELSEPIRATGGYYLVMLLQRFEPAGTKIEDIKPEDRELPASLPLARLLLPLGLKPSKALTDNAMNIANQLAQRVPNCQGLATVSKNIQGAVFMNLGSAKLAELSPQIREEMAKTEPGRIAKPFLSTAGVEIFARCDKPIEKLQAYKLPTREEIEQQLFEEQISAMARRYGRDLRRAATIETRDTLKTAEAQKPAGTDNKTEPAKKP
jgi:peptidyl-prolyl cis-trans isomerase SurA